MLGKEHFWGLKNYCDSAGKKGDEETRRATLEIGRVRGNKQLIWGYIKFEMPVDIQVEILTGV